MQASRALGHRLVRLGRYEEAVAAFRRAYELKADARLLYDIAECYREVGAVDQALFYYERYLAGWPDAFDRDEVEKKVAALEAAGRAGARRGRAAQAAADGRRRAEQAAPAARGRGSAGGSGQRSACRWLRAPPRPRCRRVRTTACPASDLGNKRFY